MNPEQGMTHLVFPWTLGSFDGVVCMQIGVKERISAEKYNEDCFNH